MKFASILTLFALLFCNTVLSNAKSFKISKVAIDNYTLFQKKSAHHIYTAGSSKKERLKKESSICRQIATNVCNSCAEQPCRLSLYPIANQPTLLDILSNYFRYQSVGIVHRLIAKILFPVHYYW